MPIYRFSAEVNVSTYTEVEADTVEEALEEAEARDVVFGGLGMGDLSDESWVVDELDGVPSNIRLDTEQN